MKLLMLRFFLLLVFLGSFSGLTAQETETIYDVDPYGFLPEKLVDYEHLIADIQFNPFDQKVFAKTTLLFRQIRTDIDSLVLLAPAFKISTIRLDKQAVEYRQTKKNLIVMLPESTKKGATHSLFLEYEVQPASELFFVGWNDTTNTMRRQIWAHRPYYWLPFAHDRLTMDMFVTFDSRYQVFSNGVRESVTHLEDGMSRWHYKMFRSHPYFSTALVIGKYRYESTSTVRGLPVELWYYPDRKDHLEPTYQHMHQMIAFCEDEFGIGYPYELYRQAPVANYLFAGMETTTSTIFGDYLHIDEHAFWERNYVNVNIHELVHQWFGNYISHLRPSDVWLTESFATYYAKQFERQLYGENFYQHERAKETAIVLNAALADDFALGSSMGQPARWYQKGSLVLDMLRDEMGDLDFGRTITFYLKEFAYSETWTPDLQKSIYQVTGRSLDWFFDQWVYRGGEPHYEISLKVENDSLRIRIEQIQEISAKRPLFETKPIVALHFNDGSTDRFQLVNNTVIQQLSRSLPADKTLAFVLFDPGDRLLKRQTFNRSFNMLANQLSDAPLMIDRYEALLELRDFAIENKRELLQTHFYLADYHLIKTEIMNQLANDTSFGILRLFDQALIDTNVYVRRAALENLREHHASLLPAIQSCLSDISYTNQRLALQKLAVLDTTHIDDYLSQTNDFEGFPGLQLRIAWLEIAASRGRQEAFDALVEYSSFRYEFRTRINAIEALVRLDYFDEMLAQNLIEAVIHWNFRLSSVAKKALVDYSDNEANSDLILRSLTTLSLDESKRNEIMQILKID
ncbi:MAG: M1 family aminopeptidase [Bacteroidetes bacterium]|jgi:aminopeptidase N|nr:M1 family aminopeptidase [Bacteroidota bacterium]